MRYAVATVSMNGPMVETGKSSVASLTLSMFGDTAMASRSPGTGISDERLAEFYSTGGPHTTTGIPYAIHGSARVVQANVTEWLASYVDPIKAIFGTSIENNQKVIIKRKYIVGGGAIITPEHAPARSVAIQEDVREVRLVRYGGDIEMNLNLFLLPKEAKEEFDMKMAAQRCELERKLTEIAYEKLMTESIPLQQALLRANPSHGSSNHAMADKIYINSVFGAMAKHPFPVANLLAAARHCNMYTPPSGDGTHSVMLVPPGMLDIAHYTRPDSMKYSISGFKQSDNSTLSLDMPGVHLEPQLGVKILVSKRMPTYEHGTAFPDIDGEGYLNEQTSWPTYYEIPQTDDEFEYGIVDFETGRIVVKDGNAATSRVYYRPKMEAMMGSVILCANPGPETGEMLFAYPSTNLSSDKEVEMLKVQLRVYMGCAVYKPDNILKLPNVSFEGLVGGHTMDEVETVTRPVSTDQILTRKDFDGTSDDTIVYSGAVYRRDKKEKGSAMWTLFSKNTGHLGILDDPDMVDRLHGMHKFTGKLD